MSRLPKEPVRQEIIVNDLRKRIIQGQLLPGSRLPTHLELAEQFDTTSVTVHRALGRLSDDGFVTASGSRGTFVSANPPHLSNYALIFPHRDLPKAPWSRFHRAIFEAAMRIEQPQSRRLSVYYDVTPHIHQTEDYDRLVHDIKSHCLAGLIFAYHPFPFGDSPVTMHPGLPRVALMSKPWHDVADAVAADTNSFLDRALDYMHACGRRRIAIIGHKFSPEVEAHFHAAIAARRMIHRPYWMQVANAHEPRYAANIARLLLHNKQSERPDALIIADDHLVEDVSAGVIASGVRVPQDLEIVAHCNYPNLPPKVLPIKLLGFDCEQLLRACIQYIDSARRGEPVNPMTNISAQFEEELVAPEPLDRLTNRKAALAEA